MKFSINIKPFGSGQLYELTNNDSQSILGVIPSCGALLNNFLIKQSNSFIDIINGYKTYDELIENITNNFKGVILSPFANRVNKASYNFNNANYLLEKVWKEKDYAIHGYLYNQNFEVIKTETNDDNACLTLQNKYDGTLSGFPFAFDTTVIYTLYKNNQFSCKTIIQNTSDMIMPMSFGWHPLFFNNININEVELKFPSLYQIDVDDDYIPTGQKTHYDKFTKRKIIGDTLFDYCFKLEEDGTAEVELFEPFNKAEIKLKIETGNNKFKYLQIYIPPQRNTIALEPMSSWPDAFNNKNDLISIQPDEFISMQYEIKADIV